MHIAFATDRDHLDYAQDDRLLAGFLGRKGLRISPAVWNDPGVRWDSYDAIIFRSVWDYFIHREEFDSWLSALEGLTVKIFNPLATIQWNKDKTYFNRFTDLGVMIPGYQIIKANDIQPLSEILERKGWDKAVVKPAVSGGAYKTWLTSREMAMDHQQELESILMVQDVIVQKFVPEILENGEWSLIFFNKKFSHAVIKKARSGDFRVQAQYGGNHHPFRPEEDILDQVNAILALIEGPLLYARVDGYVNEAAQFYLMELELIEPVLFFDSHPLACRNFYSAMNELI